MMTDLIKKALNKFVNHGAMYTKQRRAINISRKEAAQIEVILTQYDVANLTSLDAKEIITAASKQGLNINQGFRDVFHQCGIHLDSLLHLAELEQIECKQVLLSKKHRKSMQSPNNLLAQYSTILSSSPMVQTQ